MNKKKLTIASFFTMFALIPSYSSNTYFGLIKDSKYDNSIFLIKKDWSGWHISSTKDCTDWNPTPEMMDLGFQFEQSRECSYQESNTRDIFRENEAGQEIFIETEVEVRLVTNALEIQDNIGTKNYISETRTAAWSLWIDKNGLYDCSSWTPNPTTINLNQSFKQEQTCQQDRYRTQEVYNVWADGTETLIITNEENKTIDVVQTQDAIGTKNFVSETRSEDWSVWSDDGSIYDCGIWSPESSTVNLNEVFTQEQTCQQNQIRTQLVYNVWENGDETLLTTNIESKTIDSIQTKEEVGTKNYVS